MEKNGACPRDGSMRGGGEPVDWDPDEHSALDGPLLRPHLTAEEATEAAKAEGIVLLRSKNETGFRGVSRNRRKFKAEVSDRGYRHNLGNFAVAEHAALVYARYLAAERLLGASQLAHNGHHGHSNDVHPMLADGNGIRSRKRVAMHRRSRASQEDSNPDDSDGDVSPASYGRSLTSRAALSYGMLAGGNGHPTPPKALSVGSFVWARVPGMPAWPARVVDVERAAARPKLITPHVTSPQEPSYRCAV